MAENQPNFIPLIWQSPSAYFEEPSPNYSSRGSLYGVSGIPHAQFGGTVDVVGGGTNMYPYYLNAYNSLVNNPSPLAMSVSMESSGYRDVSIVAEVEVTADVTTTNNKIIFLLTRHISDDYFCSVVYYADEDFTLTTTGQTDTYEASVTMNPLWNMEDLTAVVLVQTMSGNHVILQGASSMFSGILPLFTADRLEGPAGLGVNFHNSSFPQIGIDLFEWDFDNDGTWDSNEENPSYLYEVPGVYSVTLRITADGESDQVTIEDYINVTDGSDVSGSVNGVWLADIGTYTITDDLLIEPGDALIIEPGVTIKTNNSSTIEVKGLLQAGEQGADPVIFTSDNSWKGLVFEDTDQDNFLVNCEFTKSTRIAVNVDNSHADILYSRFYENSSSGYGAAIDLLDSDNVNIGFNTIANNTCLGLTGGIGCVNSRPNIFNNVIVNNDGYFAGSLSLKQGSDAYIQNNVLAHNDAQDEIFMYASYPTFINNIILKDDNEVFGSTSSEPTVTYCCVSGGYNGTGNIDVDPMFEAPSDGIGSDFDGLNALWYLTENSLCIDSGHPDAAFNDAEDPENPGLPLWPAMGTLRNDMGAFGGTGYATTSSGNETIPVVINSKISAWPNPFNPQTTLSLNLTDGDSGQPVTLEIFNLKGQLVKTLLQDEITGTGSQYIWDGRNDTGQIVTSGIYFAQLRTFSGQNTAKLLLIK